jgi:hypothetical protein
MAARGPELGAFGAGHGGGGRARCSKPTVRVELRTAPREATCLAHVLTPLLCAKTSDGDMV